MKTQRRKRTRGAGGRYCHRIHHHHLLLRPADARRRTRTARQLLGMQERTGPRPDPALPRACGRTARRSNRGRWPSSSATTATTRPATSSPSAACTTATSTASTASPRANIRLAAHVAKRFRHHALELRRPAAGSRLRPDAGHRPLRRQPRHPPGDLRDVVDSPDAADRRRPAEPPGQPVAAPPAGTRPAAAGVRSPGPRRQAPAQPAGTGHAAPAAASST